jgi:hypothetical protein
MIQLTMARGGNRGLRPLARQARCARSSARWRSFRPWGDALTLLGERKERMIGKRSSSVDWAAGAHAAAGTTGEACQGERCLSRALRIVRSLRIHATRATFFSLPAATSRW